MRQPIFNSQFSILNLIKSMRLRTLPLSLAGVVCGSLLAVVPIGGSGWALAFLYLTTVSLQILSNLSNEMGDHLSGVDDDSREGPNYSLSEGGLTVRQMWRAINAFVIICAFSGLLMLLFSFQFSILNFQFSILLLLGAAAIWAATHYTLGKNPYGYRGLGDLFVFIFFGLVSVLGSYFVMAHTIPLRAWLILPAVGIGLLSVAVLNVNNIRDMDSDRGLRQTVPLRIGSCAARWYQTVLVVGGVCCMSVCYPYVLFMAPLFVVHLVGVWRRTGRDLDPMLPLLVMSTFGLSAVYTVLSVCGILC